MSESTRTEGRSDRSPRGQSTNQSSSSQRPGADADQPTQVPASGWKAVLKRVGPELKSDHVSLLAAGVAFKALLALFPAIVAGITIWSLVSSPDQIVSQLEGAVSALPESAGNLVMDQMRSVASQPTGALTTGLIVSVAIALWSASGGMAGLMEGTTAAYDEVDERSFPIKRGIAIALTLGAILFLLVTVGLITVVPAVLGNLGLGSVVRVLVQIGTFLALALVFMVALAVVYKYGPDRDHPQTKWATPGALVATVLWLIGSALFTVYVNNFGSFGETYGSFAGIIILMLWLLLTAFCILLGAEINSELERQTSQDTTVGEPKPMGQRGANPADTAPGDEEAR